MSLKINNLQTEIVAFVIKVIIPALIGVTVGLAFRVKNESLTFINVMLSYIIGISVAILLSPLIMSELKKDYHVITIATIAIFSEKTGEYIINRWNIDLWIRIFWEVIRDTLLNILGLGRVFNNMLSTIIGCCLIYAAIVNDFTDTMRILLLIIGICLIFSKDTLLKKIWSIIDKNKSDS